MEPGITGHSADRCSERTGVAGRGNPVPAFPCHYTVVILPPSLLFYSPLIHCCLKETGDDGVEVQGLRVCL
jgi:hypothetical protein